MKRFTGWATLGALALATAPASPAWADSAADYAKSACKDRLRRDYNAGASNVTASDRGGDRFTVTGNANRSGESARFTCRYDRGSVQSVNIERWHKSSGDGAAAAIVGVAALAAVIAAASSKKRSHEYDDYSRDQYNQYENNNYYEDSYSPISGVTCYRNQRACFNSYNNNYNPRWTQREFGY